MVWKWKVTTCDANEMAAHDVIMLSSDLQSNLPDKLYNLPVVLIDCHTITTTDNATTHSYMGVLLFTPGLLFALSILLPQKMCID